MLSFKNILVASILMIAFSACSPKDSNGSATESIEGESNGSKNATASKLNSAYTEQSYIVGGTISISCTSVLNGVKVEKTTKFECNALKAASAVALPQAPIPAAGTSPDRGAVNGQITCSYEINGVKTEKTNAADCATAEAAFNKEAEAAKAVFDAEFGNE